MADDDIQETPAAEPAGNTATDDKGENKEPSSAQDPVAKGGAEPKGDADEPAKAGGWPEDWRERLAEHRSAGNDGEYKKELRRLEKVSDPALIYGSYRDMENTWHSRGLIKVPGKDANEKEVADYRKALGVPEKADAYFEQAKIADGFVLGDADKADLADFAKVAHDVGAPQPVMDAIINKYLEVKEDQQTEQDEADYAFRVEAQRALKDELGASYTRATQSVKNLFATAPGGANPDNSESLFARLLAGRTADGTLIGNDPDFIKWAASLAYEINPAMSVVEDAGDGGKRIEDELKDISKLRRENRAAYNKDTRLQERERELLDAQSKIQARA